MTKKVSTPTKSEAREVEDVFSFPELGIAVSAKSLEEAVEKANAQVSESKEKTNE